MIIRLHGKQYSGFNAGPVLKSEYQKRNWQVEDLKTDQIPLPHILN